MVTRLFLLLLSVAVLAGCASSAPSGRAVSPAPEKGAVYVVPFSTAMVPPEVEEGVFDAFVDALNAQSAGSGVDFVILKQGTERVDPDWLARQQYVTGEILGYVEESGCCSTVLRLRSRARLHQPGAVKPVLELDVPRETFFEHDYSTVEKERRKLVEEIASTLAKRLVSALSVR